MAVFVAAVVLTVMLLVETVPSALAGLTRADLGVRRLDVLTRLGLVDGRRLWVVSLLGVLHTLAAVAVVAGLWRPAWGAAGAAVEALAFCWVLTRQAALRQHRRDLTIYTVFLGLALAVLAVDVSR
ncbi:hypothetical protein POF50_010970 [Streptomyces sp. SL13]|uniref:Uncharacterized protein n=1 Tax=Streptantibioticus silvisoli TaxID=2705255 RepID=A0AA90JX82_9ACTN|nr:hypothetical protein [Streptantibioticus silvisoli]MDI5969851.1 hypothetical protein [Streptantibioticus silvisoli]